MKKNKSHNFNYLSYFLLLLLIFTLNSCGESGNDKNIGTQQINNFKESQLDTYKNSVIYKYLKECDTKYNFDSYFKAYLEKPNYKYLSMNNSGYGKYGTGYPHFHLIVVHGKVRVSDDYKKKQNKVLYYAAGFISENKSGAVGTWYTNKKLGGEIFFYTKPISEDFYSTKPRNDSYLVKDGVMTQEELDSAIIDKEIFYLKAVKKGLDGIESLGDMMAVTYNAWLNIAKTNSDIKKCIIAAEELITEEFFKTGKIKGLYE